MKKQPGLSSLLLLGLLIINGPVAGTESTNFSFGIVPQQSADKLARLWGPILQQISQDTGVNVNFKTAPDIPTFEKRLAAGEYDFAYMNPYHYTVFNQTSGYRALVRARDKPIKGILVVHKDSPIKQLKDLDGSTLAFPAPAAFAATILTQSNLRMSGVMFDAKYVSSHDSVYRTVAKGLYPAGGGVIRTLNNVEPEIRDQLRVLWTSQGYTPHAIAVHPRVSQQAAQSLQRAFVELDQQVESAALIQAIKIKGFTLAKDSEWDDVRGLDLKELSNL